MIFSKDYDLVLLPLEFQLHHEYQDIFECQKKYHIVSPVKFRRCLLFLSYQNRKSFLQQCCKTFVDNKN